MNTKTTMAKIIAEVSNRTCIDKIDAEVLAEILKDALNEYYDAGHSDGYDDGYENGYADCNAQKSYQNHSAVQWHPTATPALGCKADSLHLQPRSEHNTET